jgi:beta-galactosidase
VPHTNIRLPWHSFDEKSYEFVSIYRRRFRLPASARGRRVFVDFEGVMTASTVWLNGVRLGEYKGGFTPFSFELTPHVRFDADNLLAVQVDSTERADIPPFGYEVDYLTFGGIYREVSLRIVSPTYLENIFAQPKDVLTGHPSLDVQCFLESNLRNSGAGHSLEAALYDGDKLVAKTTQAVPGWDDEGPKPQTLHIDNLGAIELWNLRSPKLYRRGASAARHATAGPRHEAHRLPRGPLYSAGLLAQRRDREAARTGPAPDLSLGWPGDAGPRATPRCRHPAQEPAVQHCTHLALSAVAPFS